MKYFVIVDKNRPNYLFQNIKNFKSLVTVDLLWNQSIKKTSLYNSKLQAQLIIDNFEKYFFDCDNLSSHDVEIINHFKNNALVQELTFTIRDCSIFEQS